MGISHYQMAFQVRSYEVGRLGIVSAGTLLRYLEHLATEASAAAGYPRSWYDDHDTAWVVRHMEFEQERPLRLGDALLLETWPSQFARIQAYREYLVSNAATTEVLARAHSHWVYVGRARGLPTRLPADFPDHAIPDPQEVELIFQPAIERLANDGLHFKMQLQARHTEADIMEHINNSVYMDWLEEAVYEAMRSPTFSEAVHMGASADWHRSYVQQARLDYMKPCLPSEALVIKSVLRGSYAQGLAWKQTIFRGMTEEAILQAESLWSWLV